MRYTSLQDLACQNCHPLETFNEHRHGGIISNWQASRKQSVMVALVTVISGFGVMLLALLAWGGRTELGAASLSDPVSAEQHDAWTNFEKSEGEEWHTLPVIVQRAETSFAPLPTSWEREGRNGMLVWIFQGDASQGSLARFTGRDGSRLRSLLAKGTALRLTVQARRLELFETQLVEISRVEKLGWGSEQREFETPHRTLSPPSTSLTASAWLGP